MSRRLLLFVLVSLLAVTLGFWSFTPAQAVLAIKYCGFWIILAAFVCFAVALVQSLRDTVPELRAWRRWVLPVTGALAAAGFLHLHERHEFKIVADEVVLQLTAKQMHFHREVAVVVRGYEYAGNFEPLVTFVDKRPLLFPFLISVVHDVSGYRVENAFILNGVLSIAMMVLLLLIGRRIGGWGAGLAAVLLAATVPLIAQNACGSGFEILNLVMILVTVWLGMRLGDAPADPTRLSAFVLSAVLLAQVRYESALFIVPAAAIIIYVWARQKTLLLPWGLLAAPLLLVLCPLQMNVFKLSQSAWQLNDIAGADKPFGFRYFYDNVGHAFNFFLSFDGTQPNSVIVAVLGAFGVGLFVMLLYREHRTMFRNEPAFAVLSLFLCGLLLHTALMLCYFWGHWDDLVIHRLSLPAHLLLILAVILVWPKLISYGRRWHVLSGIAAAYLMFFTIPANAMHRFTQQNFAATMTNWLGGYIRALGDRTALAIDESAGLQWFLYNKSSVTATAIAARPEAFIFHFRNHSFAEFYVVQRVAPIVGSEKRLISLGDDFGGSFDLELVEERAFAPLYLVRLSRITRIHDDKFKEWAKHRRDHPVPITSGTPMFTGKDGEDLLNWLRQLP